MPEVSAGVLAWRRGASGPEFLLVHPGGPFWRGKDAAAWSIPKGRVEAGEADWAAALREFAEELGQPFPEAVVAGEPTPLAPCRMPGGKRVLAWLVEADLDVSKVSSNLFEMEWPPRSGRRQAFPEVDRAGWFDGPSALVKLHKGLRPILAEALDRLAAPSGV